MKEENEGHDKKKDKKRAIKRMGTKIR